ncbi:hypothetical protein BJD99_00980 [Rhodococcus sp. 1163]|uniref:recombinase family protein n=1 Tax=Rhodococcus sp. 1163 TaxID=1905289 RepID=UPI0009FFDCA0|nr:recombinase family protein [Rhodococcus sp. 1163]ORI11745.1 hypothetical protein BJD99_00980 [Rhodococcus sp. 1163]
MRAAIYCRMSRDREGSGLGIARQLEDCEKLAAERGFEVVATFSDNDLSAYGNKYRPEYERMLAAIQRKDFDVIVAWHSDRITRHPSQLEQFITACELGGVMVHTVQAGQVDLDTPQGQMMARIAGAVARHEVDHARKRMKRAHEQAAMDGKWRARRRPFGYLQDGSALVETEADALRTAADDLLRGVSLRAIARDWNERGITTTGVAKGWNATGIRRLLSNPRYAGLQEYNGKVVGTGNWPTVIDVDTHHAVTGFLADPTRSNRASYERRYQGSGVYRCGVCGAPMTMMHGTPHESRPDKDGVVKKSSGLHYRCTKSTHLSRQGEAVDEVVTKAVLGWLSSAKALQKLSVETVDFPAEQRKRDGLQGKLKKYTLMFASDDISAEQFKDGTAEVRAQIAAIDAKLSQYRGSSPMLDLAMSRDDIQERWDQLTPDVRGSIINDLVIVTIRKGERGLRKFDPETVNIQFRISNSEES